MVDTNRGQSAYVPLSLQARNIKTNKNSNNNSLHFFGSKTAEGIVVDALMHKVFPAAARITKPISQGAENTNGRKYQGNPSRRHSAN